MFIFESKSEFLDRITAVVIGAVLWGSGAYRPRTRVVRCHYGFQGPILTDEALENGATLAAAMSRLTIQAKSLYWVIKKVRYLREQERPMNLQPHESSISARRTLVFLMLRFIYRGNATRQITVRKKGVFCCIGKERLLLKL
jgi:hypothetical protein